MELYPEINFILTFVLFGLPSCLGYIKVNFGTERHSMCSKIKILGIYTQSLRHHDNSGLILVEEDFQYHANEWQKDLECTLKVNYPSGTDGVIAVIQSLTMRRNESTGQCIDFMRFKASDGTSSDQFCGNFDVVSKMNGRPSILDVINYGNSFRTKRHNLHVDITFGKEPFKGKNDKISFRVVFTAYKNCSEQSVLDLTYRQCKELSDFCIYNGFFNDNYVNCPFAGCVDEGTCSKFVAVQKPATVGTKLLVSSISFLFILFVTFLISIWACKKHKVMCFSEQFAHPERNRQTRVIELNEHTSTRSRERQQSSSAPPIELDKDLPPKYEDLFPDR